MRGDAVPHPPPAVSTKKTHKKLSGSFSSITSCSTSSSILQAAQPAAPYKLLYQQLQSPSSRAVRALALELCIYKHKREGNNKSTRYPTRAHGCKRKVIHPLPHHEEARENQPSTLELPTTSTKPEGKTNKHHSTKGTTQTRSAAPKL